MFVYRQQCSGFFFFSVLSPFEIIALPPNKKLSWLNFSDIELHLNIGDRQERKYLQIGSQWWFTWNTHIALDDVWGCRESLSESFLIGVGLRQGCVTSPWLLNILSMDVWEKLNGYIWNLWWSNWLPCSMTSDWTCKICSKRSNQWHAKVWFKNNDCLGGPHNVWLQRRLPSSKDLKGQQESTFCLYAFPSLSLILLDLNVLHFHTHSFPSWLITPLNLLIIITPRFILMALNPNMALVLPFCSPPNISSSNYQVCPMSLRLSYMPFSLLWESFFPSSFVIFTDSQNSLSLLCSLYTINHLICEIQEWLFCLYSL